MKFNRIEIQRFGPLAGIDSGGESPLPGLVAVLGPNEAGKSAFHQLLGAVLYGFHPANGEQNAFAPWGGGNIEVRAELEAEGDQKVGVHRKLLKTPRAQLVRGDRVEKLDNRSLSLVGRIERKVYTEVYAITLAQLTGLREAAWETVQEQLIVGMGAQDLRSARAVMRGFRDAAKKLWQPTRRGNQLHRELGEELAQLGRSRRDAEARAMELRGLVHELAEHYARLETLAEERASRTKHLQLLRELLPLRKRLGRLEELEGSLGDRQALAGAPRDPMGKSQELNERLDRSRQRMQELAESRGQIQSAAKSFTDSERRILELASSLRPLVSNAPLVHERASRKATLESEISALEGGIREASLALLGIWPTGSGEPEAVEGDPVNWTAAGRPFRALEMAALRERISEAENERRNRQSLQERLDQGTGKAPASAPLLSVLAAGVFALASVGIVLGGAFLARPAMAGIGVTLLVLAGGALARSWSRRSAAHQVREVGLEEEQRLRSRIADAEGRERLATAAARTLLIPLGLQASHLDAPGGALLAGISELKNLFHSRHDRTVELGRLSDEEAVFDVEFDRLVPGLGLELPEDRGLALLQLGQMLQAVDERRVRAEEAESEKARLDAAREREQAEFDELVERRRLFDEQVLNAGATLDEEGLHALAERLADLEMYLRLKDELESEIGDLGALRERIEEAEAAGTDWNEDPDHESAEQVRLDAIDDESHALRERIGQLQERESALLQEDTPDLVDGQILCVRARLREVERERDRNIVLAGLLQCAESRFRSAHQPDLLRRAEEHLSVITAGRYERILVGKVGDEQGFFLDAPHLPEPTPVAEPLSTGTREQVYLALRLAIVEHLDRDAERLPLLMDEVLVNWDPERRARVLDLLARLAALRQIFLFTCHPHIAGEVTARGGRLLELSPS